MIEKNIFRPLPNVKKGSLGFSETGVETEEDMDIVLTLPYQEKRLKALRKARRDIRPPDDCVPAMVFWAWVEKCRRDDGWFKIPRWKPLTGQVGGESQEAARHGHQELGFP